MQEKQRTKPCQAKSGIGSGTPHRSGTFFIWRLGPARFWAREILLRPAAGRLSPARRNKNAMPSRKFFQNGNSLRSLST
jgi:hypothetical protein